MPRCLTAFAGTLALLTALAAPAAQDTIHIAHIYSQTGPLQAYGQQTQRGLSMGLEYATGGTLQVGGKRIIVTEKDDQGNPELGRQLLEEAYGREGADIAVGPTASPVALAMLEVAARHRKLLLVEPAVADSITGAHWNPFVFRTGRSSTQDAMANAVALDKPGHHIAVLAQDNAFGREGVQAFRRALKAATLVHEEYLPATTSQFADAGQRLIDVLRDRPGRKLIFVLWAGGNPFRLADDVDLKRHGIEIATGGNTLSAMTQYNRFPGMEGATYYHFSFARNPANRWLNLHHLIRYGGPPDFFTAGGFAAAMALVTALQKTGGETSGETLVHAMKGMSFDTPKGRMRFREEDHQALQPMYHFRVSHGARPGTVADLYLIKEIGAAEIPLPVHPEHVSLQTVAAVQRP